MSSSETNNTDLAEEIEAINAIYDADTITLSPSSSASADATTIKLQIPNHPHLSVLLAFEPTYPDTPPTVLGTASTASRGEGKIAIDVLEDILGRTYQPGAVCIFEVINEAIEAFEELQIGGPTDEPGTAGTGAGTTTKNTATENGSDDSIEAVNFASLSLHESLGLSEPPPWILSEIVTEKKSVFVGRAAHVTSVDQAKAYLDYLLASDRKVASATHNISAWRIKQQSKPPTGQKDSVKGPASSPEMIIQDFDDDGETAAGGRLLHLMQLMDVWDVVVVVTRWYGGIHLGPDRFRIINAVGRDALVRGGFEKQKDAGAAEKGKRKGKK
ncbi:ribosomal protein S5 domain 2-type protein [Aspergillus crustosus]